MNFIIIFHFEAILRSLIFDLIYWPLRLLGPNFYELWTLIFLVQKPSIHVSMCQQNSWVDRQTLFVQHPPYCRTVREAKDMGQPAPAFWSLQIQPRGKIVTSKGKIRCDNRLSNKPSKRHVFFKGLFTNRALPHIHLQVIRKIDRIEGNKQIKLLNTAPLDNK